MNKWCGVGNLTRDPEIRMTTNGRNYCLFSVAINRPYKGANDQTQTDFINCVMWGDQSKNFGSWCSKGTKISIEGSIQSRSFETASGDRRFIQEVNVEKWRNLSPRVEKAETTVMSGPDYGQPSF